MTTANFPKIIPGKQPATNQPGSTNTRNVGSGFTTFYWNHNLIAFLDEIHDSGQQPIAQYQAVTPLGDQYPREFVLPRVKTEGTLQLVIRELWAQPVWWALVGFTGTNNIIDVYNIMAASNSPIQCTTLISLPNGKTRGWQYQNVTLTTIDDGETVTIGALTMPRTLQAVYSNKFYFTGETAAPQSLSASVDA
jgi:hypothetical protein